MTAILPALLPQQVSQLLHSFLDKAFQGDPEETTEPEPLEPTLLMALLE